VAGLLLVESYHEDFEDYVPQQTTSDKLRGLLATLRLLLRYKAFYRDIFSRMYATWPEEVRNPFIDWHLRSLTKSLQEFPASDRTRQGKLSTELRSGGSIPDVPLIVLGALDIDPFYQAVMLEPYLRKMIEGQRVLYRTLASSAPRGEHREAEAAGHDTFHIDRPDVLVQAIRDLINVSLA
jgi:hypothetical protein